MILTILVLLFYFEILRFIRLIRRSYVRIIILNNIL